MAGSSKDEAWTRVLRALGGAALLLGGLGACAGEEAVEPPDLVLIVLDTTRADRTSVYGAPEPTTPFLESFAAEGTRFDRAYSSSCWTLPAHASMFTGQPPEEHRADQLNVRVVGELPLLAQRLAAAGYQTSGFTENPWIAERTGLAQGFQTFYEAWPGGSVERLPGDGTNLAVAGVRDWLAERRDPRRPAFVFVNLVRPHEAYRPPWETAQRFFDDQESWKAAVLRYAAEGSGPLFHRHYAGIEPLDEQEWGVVRRLYDAELLCLDELVRQLVTDLQSLSPDREQLVLIVSDHGENFGDHGHASHMFDLGESLTRVVLLARGPGFEAGAVDERLAQVQDVYPTLLGAAGLESPPGEARDLRAPPDAARVLLARAAWPRDFLGQFPEEVRESGVLAHHLRALWASWDGRYKLVVGSDGSEVAYDLSSDPDELHPLEPDAVPAERLERLRSRVAASRRVHDGLPSGEDRTDGDVDEAALEALRALGYVR